MSRERFSLANKRDACFLQMLAHRSCLLTKCLSLSPYNVPKTILQKLINNSDIASLIRRMGSSVQFNGTYSPCLRRKWHNLFHAGPSHIYSTQRLWRWKLYSLRVKSYFGTDRRGTQLYSISNCPYPVQVTIKY